MTKEELGGVSWKRASLVAGIGIAITAFVFNPPKNSQDWAAWVQAVGSIGAIGGAFAVAQQQRQAEADTREAAKRESEDVARREQQRLEDVVTLVCTDAVFALTEGLLHVSRHVAGQRFDLRPARLADAQYMLRAAMDQPISPQLAEVLLSVQACVSRSLRDVEQWHGTRKELDIDRRQIFLARVEKARSRVEELSGHRPDHSEWKRAEASFHKSALRIFAAA